MTKLNDELPEVMFENAGHSEEMKKFFSEYFQRQFLWQYGAGAEGKYAHRSYFVSDYHNNLYYTKMDPTVKEIWKKICQKLDINPYIQVGRCYLLGQTKEMDGPWHTDSADDNCRTIVYYPCFNPHHKHRGTEFEFADGSIEETPYMQDYFSYFDAKVKHRGLSTTSTKEMRVALVFQCVYLDNCQKFIFEKTCGNDERLDDVISKEVPR
jgi:hypothetical protein